MRKVIGVTLACAGSLSLGACSRAPDSAAAAPAYVTSSAAPTTPAEVTSTNPPKPPMPSSLPPPPAAAPRTPYLDTVGDSRQDSPAGQFLVVNSAGLIVGDRFIQVFGGTMGTENPVDPGRSGVAVLPGNDLAGDGAQWHFYPMSSDHGPLRVVGVSGSIVTLTDKAGGVVKFDAATMNYVN